MDEHLNEQLSAYVDGDLSVEQRTAAEAHLAVCEACRAAVQDLRRIVGLASSLDDRPPAQDLWPGIAERIGARAHPDVIPLEPRRRRFTFSVPQLAAAGVTLALLSAAGGVGAVRLLSPEPTPVAVLEPVAITHTVSDAVGPYDRAIHDLEAVLVARRGDLDPATVRAVESSLDVIDQAIAQARAAVARDPNNLYLNGHLRSTLDRKLDLLRRVAMLPRVS